MMALLGVFELAVVASAFVGVLFSSEPVAGPSEAVGTALGRPIVFLMHYQMELTALQGLLGLAVLVFGAGIWSGRSWARRGGQVSMCLVATLFLANGAVMALSIPVPEGGGVPVAAVMSLFRVASVGVGVVWALLSIAPVYLLSRADARTWCVRSRPTRE